MSDTEIPLFGAGEPKAKEPHEPVSLADRRGHGKNLPPPMNEKAERLLRAGWAYKVRCGVRIWC